MRAARSSRRSMSAAATALIDDLCSSGIEALTISLMHSYANAAHERALRDIVAERYPGHSGVALLRHPARIPRIRPRHHHGDERLCAADHAALSVAHRGPAAAGGRQGAPPHRPLRRRADERRGGLRTAGPHGAVGSGRRRHQHDDAVAPLRLLASCSPSTWAAPRPTSRSSSTARRRSRARPRSGMFPAKVPTLDVRSVGAGGGSIADVSELTGSLRVGPRSAGARPGAGRLWPRRHGTDRQRCQSRARLPAAGAARRRHERSTPRRRGRPSAGIGETLGLSPEEAAKGIIDIANEVMLGALRVITVQRGLDPRDFGIVAFGGAGPLHANALAELLGCYPVLVPANPGVLCRRSASSRPISRTSSCRPISARPRGSTRRASGRASPSSRKRPGPGSTEQEVAPADASIDYALDLRYEQQGFEVAVAGERRSWCAERARSRRSSPTSTRCTSGSMACASPCRWNWWRCASSRAARRRRWTKSRRRRRAATSRRPSSRRGRPISTAPGATRRTTTAAGSASATASTARRSSANTTRTTVLLPGHYAEVDTHGNILIWPVAKGA